MALSKVTEAIRDGANVAFSMMWAKIAGSAPTAAVSTDVTVPVHAVIDTTETLINPATSDNQTSQLTQLSNIVTRLTAGATAIAKAEDVAAADADVGVPAMAIRKATPANTSGTDGDYEMLQIANGRLWGRVIVTDVNDAPILSAANALNSTGAGLFASQIVAQFDDSSPTAITENQFGNLRMSTNRNLYGTIRDAAGNERGVNVTADNALSVKQNRSATGTQTSVAGSASDVTILASNANRLGGTIYNDSTATLYLLFASGTSSASNFSFPLFPNDTCDIPALYTGVIKGIWSAATGNARVTEFT